VKYAKFDETVDLTMRSVSTRVTPTRWCAERCFAAWAGQDQTVAVIASGDRQKEATDAGADFVGGEEMVEKIQKENWTAFDALIATPDMMRLWDAWARCSDQGPDAQSKTGTVTMDVAAAVKEIRRQGGVQGRQGPVWCMCRWAS